VAYPAIIRLLLTLSILSVAALSPAVEAAPTPIPSPPQLALHSYMLMDATTGKILAAHDADTREQPASLTKMLTLYIAFQELNAWQIHLDDEVTVSKKAWRTGGSRMFLQVGTKVSVKDLIQGIIVQSGNDAAVALAQDVAGSTATFVQMMNQTAARLGMKGSHFADVDGLPVPHHYSTAHDLAILTRALIRDFPEYYHYLHLQPHQAIQPQPAAVAGSVRGRTQDRAHRGGGLLPGQLGEARRDAAHRSGDGRQERRWAHPRQ